MLSILWVHVSLQPSGKKRLILDLSYINNFLILHRVKYEYWKIVLSYFQTGCFMITFDLKRRLPPYLNSSWSSEVFGLCMKVSRGSFHTIFCLFTVLLFGLYSAPYIFTKCLKPLEKYWRFNGVNIAIFLYDSWLIDSDRDTCAALATYILIFGLI